MMWPWACMQGNKMVLPGILAYGEWRCQLMSLLRGAERARAQGEGW